MKRSDYEIVLSCVEILRDGGMDYATAVRLLEESVPIEALADLCSRLEEWESETGVRAEQAVEDARVNRYLDEIKSGDKAAVVV